MGDNYIGKLLDYRNFEFTQGSCMYLLYFQGEVEKN